MCPAAGAEAAFTFRGRGLAKKTIPVIARRTQNTADSAGILHENISRS